MLDDKTLAILGDREAAERLTSAGVLLECPYCKSNKVKVDHNSRRAGFTGLDDRVEYQTYSVRCNSCHARGSWGKSDSFFQLLLCNKRFAGMGHNSDGIVKSCKA